MYNGNTNSQMKESSTRGARGSRGGGSGGQRRSVVLECGKTIRGAPNRIQTAINLHYKKCDHCGKFDTFNCKNEEWDKTSANQCDDMRGVTESRNGREGIFKVSQGTGADGASVFKSSDTEFYQAINQARTQGLANVTDAVIANLGVLRAGSVPTPKQTPKRTDKKKKGKKKRRKATK